MITHLLDLCKSELELDSLPEIHIMNEPLAQASFGEFDGRIRVVTKDRHPIDVMRTLAHELTHYKQMDSGMELDGNDGSDTENGANAIAGIILRKFAQKYPDYFVDSLP